MNPNEPPENEEVKEIHMGPSSGIRSIKDMFKLLKSEDKKRQEQIEEENSSNDEGESPD